MTIIAGLNIACWNARGIMPGSVYLDYILKTNKIDICAISEHWLFPHSLNFLSSINTDYDNIAISDSDLIYPTTICRGKGGVALLWHKRLSQSITRIDTDDDRIVGISVKRIFDTYLTIFSVYLPSSNYPSDLYRDYTNKLADLHAQHSSFSHVFYLGDMNSQINGPRCITKSSFRVRTMERFLQQTQMCSINVQPICEGPKYTFSPYTSNENIEL